MRDHEQSAVSLSGLFAHSLTELRRPPAGQIPFLDGLRSVAILLVLSGHLSADFAKAYGPTLYSKLPFVANGWIGVDLFFVLSGFFIGGQLWKELKTTRTVRVGKFMVRRGFRIWPLYYFVFLSVLVFSQTIGQGAAAKEYGWSDLVFLTNYHNRGLVMGSWSLCTEEQFYIIAPLALYLFGRRMQPVSRCRPWLWVLLCALPLLRAVIWVAGTGHLFGPDPVLFSKLYYMSITHCDGLIMGLIIANFWELRDRPAAKLARSWALVAIAIVVTAALHILQKEIFDFSALAVLFGSFVWLGLQRNIPIFNSRIFFWISRLSFGMYLNHEYLAPWVVKDLVPHLFFSRMHLLSNLAAVLLLIVASGSVALVTFCLVEHPFLQLRKIVLGGAAHVPALGDFTPVTQ